MDYRQQFERLLGIINDRQPDALPEIVDETERSWDDYSFYRDYNHLYWMILEMLHYLEETSLDKDFDEGKVNRWLGFIQGSMWSYGMTTIKAEREAITESKDWCKC